MTKRKQIKSIEFRELSFEMKADTPIFNDINFEFPTSGICWIKSVAGAGKTSLLRILDGLVMPTSGSYLINGNDVTEMSFDEFNSFRLNFGYGFDFGGMISNRTLYDNLYLPLEYNQHLTPEEADDRIQGVLQLFGIKDEAQLRPSAVTGSIRKALCVARAFIHNPQIILLDDPTTGLRAEVKSTFKTIVRNQRVLYPDSAIYIATEDEEFMEPLVDSIIEVHENGLQHMNIKEKAA